MDYLCGFEVADFPDLPEGFERLRVPAGRYAVFLHRDHVASVHSTWRSIWESWLPASQHKVADGPTLERYGSEFDPRTGNGGFEIWIPLRT